MPQMAPIMWLPLFTLIIIMLLMVKSVVYFISNTTLMKAYPEKTYFNTNWLW